MKYFRTHVLVCVDPECLAKGAHGIVDALNDELVATGLIDEIQVLETSRIGACAQGPEFMVYPEGVHYVGMTVDDIPYIVEEHFLKGRIAKKFILPTKKVEDEELSAPTAKEIRVVLRNCGVIDPENIEDYIAQEGYMALAKVLTDMSPEDVVEEMKKSGLRGRGGAGFPTYLKWNLTRQTPSDIRFVVCNADEGDPGAFMNRRVLESDPHSVIEGMAIAAYAIGAQRGYIYCRAEYPIAVRTLNLAIEQAKSMGLLGENIMGTNFSIDLEVRMGAGAFVCGEETAMMASIEGRVGEPRTRPPYPAQSGLWGKPTNINNTKTWAWVPHIINNGADWFASIGNDNNRGTMIFSLVGKVNNTGLVEVPMGISIRELIEGIGGGVPEGKTLKAVQTGGPSGGCIPESMFDLPMDYDSLRNAGSIMGSGGVIVMDEDTCMVDVARYFLDFCKFESCGKCNACREGVKRMWEIVDYITRGYGEEGDIELLEELAHSVKIGSLCGLGQTAPNPVLTTIKYFRDEYEAHIHDKTCPAGVCKALILFEIIPEPCTGCTLCARYCPVEAISGEKGGVHVIDESICIRCGVCRDVCNFDAVVVR